MNAKKYFYQSGVNKKGKKSFGWDDIFDCDISKGCILCIYQIKPLLKFYDHLDLKY